MLFDRYEIHIQDFVDLLRGSSSFPGARLRLYNFFKISRNQNFENKMKRKHQQNDSSENKKPLEQDNLEK